MQFLRKITALDVMVTAPVVALVTTQVTALMVTVSVAGDDAGSGGAGGQLGESVVAALVTLPLVTIAALVVGTVKYDSA